MEWCNQVTGSARGLPGAAWRATVCVNYSVHADAAEALVSENVAAGGQAIAMAADVEEQIEYASAGGRRHFRLRHLRRCRSGDNTFPLAT